MLFIHQQIHSFLNLGACKEYPNMARPKSPKKSNEVKETVAATSNPLPLSEAGLGQADGSSAVAVAGNPTPHAATQTQSEARKPAKKPEIVRTEPRANLVPINVEEEVRRLAYLMSERRGFEPGHEAEDWLTAEREVRQRYRQQSA
jgi:hypothetical protein